MAEGDAKPNGQGDAADNPMQNIDWDDSRMSTTFANVVNGASTREEITLFFGINQSWNASDSNKVRIELSDRIILTPYAGKRLLLLLSALIKQYEDRHGKLEIATMGPPSATGPAPQQPAPVPQAKAS